MNFIKKQLARNLLLIPLAFPGASFAASTTFYLLNSSDSVINPITITNATLSYGVSGQPNECTGSTPLTPYLNLGQDPTVKTGQQFTITFDPSRFASVPDYCYYDTGDGNFGPEQFTLQISQVDSKGIDQTCKISGDYLESPEAKNSGYTIKITETANHFFCEFPIGAIKKSK